MARARRALPRLILRTAIPLIVTDKSEARQHRKYSEIDLELFSSFRFIPLRRHFSSENFRTADDNAAAAAAEVDPKRLPTSETKTKAPLFELLYLSSFDKGMNRKLRCNCNDISVPSPPYSAPFFSHLVFTIISLLVFLLQLLLCPLYNSR